MSMKFKFAVPVLAALLGAAAVPAMAQQGGGGGGNGGGGNGNGGGGGGRGNFNPAQFQQQRMDRLKTQLGATDDEFTALQPKIQAVMDAQRANMVGFGGRGGPGGGGGRRGQPQGGAGGAGGAAAPQSEVAKAAADLQTTLDQKDATADDIKGKLEALRNAKKAAKDTLSKAQEDLKSVLTQRQEAVMVESGMLD